MRATVATGAYTALTAPERAGPAQGAAGHIGVAPPFELLKVLVAPGDVVTLRDRPDAVHVGNCGPVPGASNGRRHKKTG